MKKFYLTIDGRGYEVRFPFGALIELQTDFNAPVHETLAEMTRDFNVLIKVMEVGLRYGANPSPLPTAKTIPNMQIGPYKAIEVCSEAMMWGLYGGEPPKDVQDALSDQEPDKSKKK